MKLAIIGGGAMGEAIIRGILAVETASPEDIKVFDINASRMEALRLSYKITPCADYAATLSDSEIVLIAVKPQNLPVVLDDLKGKLRNEQTALSIVAGFRIADIARGLEHSRIARAMPNTPAQIGAGITVWTASADMTAGQKESVKKTLEALGRQIFVPDEEYIDMATAVSGSGPAFIFYVIEGLVDAAMRIGLPREMADELVVETVLGSALLIRQTGQQPADLRKMVTSPGGTTEAGVSELEAGNVRGILSRVVAAAHRRAKELGNN